MTVSTNIVIFTERPGHARKIAACVKGYDMIVAVGGDGTVGDVNSLYWAARGTSPH
jgi:diacylglycerol kinase family enzyme